MKARFISEGMTIMSCSIRSLDVDLTVPWSQSSAFGYDMSSSGASLISASYKPSYFRVYHDHCTRNEAVAIYGVGAGSGQTAGLGALATFTSTGFDTMGLRDLGRSGSSGSLCSSLSASACSSLQIVDATFQNGWLFVLTSAGLFKTTESFKTVRNVSVTASFTRLMTGLSLLDSGEANTKLHGNVQGKTDCMRIGQDYLYVSYLSNVVYASASNAVLGIWSPLLNLESIPGLGASYTFISSERDVVNSAHVFLVGVPLVSQAGCPSSRLCQFDKVKVLSVTDTSSSITYSFPESFITSGLHFHGSNNDLFAFGSEVSSSCRNRSLASHFPRYGCQTTAD